MYNGVEKEKQIISEKKKFVLRNQFLLLFQEWLLSSYQSFIQNIGSMLSFSLMYLVMILGILNIFPKINPDNAVSFLVTLSTSMNLTINAFLDLSKLCSITIFF